MVWFRELRTQQLCLTYYQKNLVSDSTTTPDEATYIARHLGAQHLPLTTIIPISVVYSTIFIGQAHDMFSRVFQIP